nr:MAG TPA: hypothetical protein [Caudoviricetes sp.]
MLKYVATDVNEIFLSSKYSRILVLPFVVSGMFYAPFFII